MRQHFLTPVLQVQSKTPHLLIAGVSGYGKGMFGEGYSAKYCGRFKVWDINSESRGEGMYYGLKQDEWVFKQRLNIMSNNIFNPQQYPNEIIMFLGKNIEKLPKLPKNIKVCVFNEDWLTNDDLKDFLAFNESQAGLMDTLFEIHGDRHLTLSYVYEYLTRAGIEGTSQKRELKRYGAHYVSINTIKRRARSLLRSGIFYNDQRDVPAKFKYLNIEESARDKDSITTFSTYLIEDEYIRYICVNVLLKKLIELIELRQTDIPMLFYIREGNDFYYQKDPPPYVYGIRNSIEKILRKGRFIGKSKIMVVMDTQLIKDIPDQVFNAFNKFMIFRLPLSDSKKLLYKATIPSLYLYNLSKLEVGMAMYIANGLYYYPIYTAPTFHKKSEPDFDVFEYLGSIYNFEDYSQTYFLKLMINPLINQNGKN